jgi:aspartate kinase
MDFIVCKFGGSSVATKEKIERVKDIISRNDKRRCVVVSAPGKAPGQSVKVTDMLIAATQKALASTDYSDEVEKIKERYREIYSPLGIDSETLESILDNLDSRFSLPHQPSEKYRDAVVAIGEEFNARCIAAYLVTQGINAVYVDPKEAGLIVTPEFGNAQPIEGIALKMADLKRRCSESVVIFPGFFGVTEQGDIATFSRGGSDLSGAIVAEALDAVEYENWTDVDGIFCSNPELVDNPVQIPALTYKEMRELSYIGFNVFHEEAVRPAMRKKIPIRLRNTNNLDNEGTLIVYERMPGERDVIGIASGDGYCSFTLEKFLMNRERGFGRRLLSIFEEMELSYEHCPSGVDNISIILDQKQLKPESANAIIRAIEDGLKPDSIRTEFGIALIAVVGEGLLHKVGVLAQAAGALSNAGVNIKMANQGSSEISMIFGIDASDEKRAVSALYTNFFGK